jgi:WD40 repeat protein
VGLGNEGEVGIAFYDTETGERLLDFGGTPYGGLAAAFSRDGRKFVVGSFTGQVFVFDVEALLSDAPVDQALDFEIAAHDTLVLGVVTSPNGDAVATFGWDEPLRLWDLETGAPRGEFGSGTPDRPPLGDFHPTLPYLMVASPPNIVRIHTLDVDELIAIAESRFSRDMTDAECQQYFREPCPVS